ncbi:Aldo-keto reductase family 1 member [Wickerhamomyces ciferrii]|uniref:Aldo-keto reductase family 1 member n=1 Tax=Wickerhamomyces ciferrii (strain ATCC 14091 / BCRC 22168 / CBS 111 / JCM 3599 / NBRC 0793 / NRRL Y-1031 F-60-10) TaxID=1206466 RepID=K0KFQ9_WICCF|nr:Aldo-keto reductase family 1 member [Wickerhamomyces ciferrii]CCH41751.1 Aldo-keto reductase family 1 member [Wickerhamomyces ciferrii]
MSKLTPTSFKTLSNGSKIPITGFGVYLTPPGETYNIVLKALESGYRHIDSARYYENEQESGDAILKFLETNPQVKRSDIWYTTKLFNLNYDDAKAAIKESFERVKGLGYIDLFLIHAPITNKTKRLGQYKALQEAVDQGIVKSIGVSNYGIKHLEELLSWNELKYKPVVNQVELHPWLPRKDIQEFTQKNGIALEAYSPLTQGKYLDAPEVVEISKKTGFSPAQILLKWSFEQGFIVLAKTANPDRLKPNYNVLKDVEISKEDLSKLEFPDSYKVFAWDPATFEDTE